MNAALVDRIDALLPQTQCQRCGYPACRPYAEAIATGAAGINQCPPGGEAGIAALAELLGVTPMAMNPANGAPITQSSVALIDEAACIGCTKCIQACPVDAIIGAAQRMHTVISDECSGCALCIPPCPVDCIVMEPSATVHLDRAAQYRQRFEARRGRLRRQDDEQAAERERRRALLQPPSTAAAMAPTQRDEGPLARALAVAARPPR